MYCLPYSQARSVHDKREIKPHRGCCDHCGRIFLPNEFVSVKILKFYFGIFCKEEKHNPTSAVQLQLGLK